MTKPTMLSWLMLNPVRCSAATPIASESGMEIITTSAARQPSGSRVSSTRAMASPKSRRNPSSRWATLRA